MTDVPAQRRVALTWAGVCLLVVVALLVPVSLGWTDLQSFDTWIGTDPQAWTYDHEWLRHVAHAVSVAFSTWPMTAYTLLAAALLFRSKHRRAALFTVAAMLATSLATTTLKVLVGRDRPVWEDPVEQLSSKSFPSGHSSGIAAAATVTTVLTLMLVRRRGVRRLLVGVAVLLALVVGVDRILLGVHNLSDVVAGWALGIGLTLVVLALVDPTPRSIALTADALPEVFRPEQRQLAVVLNPVKVDDVEAFRTMVEQMAGAAGFADVGWYPTTVEDPGTGQAFSAAVAGADLVIACGGDGTVRTVCEELAGTGVPVGIVPAGTGNLLARNLELPLYLRAAVDVALNGQDRAIDMVTVTGDNMDDATFLVMAGMGFDAAIMEGVNEDIKARVGWVAYVISGLKSLMFPAVRVEISVDGGDFTKHRARTIVVGNVGFLQAGMPLIPDAEIDDGQLDVVLLYPRRFLSWLPLAVRVLSRNRRTDELVTRMRGREVVVRAGSDSPRQLDGDLIEPGRELHCECVHGRLLVRVPR